MFELPVLGADLFVMAHGVRGSHRDYVDPRTSHDSSGCCSSASRDSFDHRTAPSHRRLAEQRQAQPRVKKRSLRADLSQSFPGQRRTDDAPP
jgi:hypothetical protein